MPPTGAPQGHWAPPHQAPGYAEPPQQGYDQQQPYPYQQGYPQQQAYGNGHAAQAPYAQPQGQGYYFPQGAEPAQGQPHQQQQWNQQPQPDLRGYDLGSYMPAAAPGQMGEPQFQQAQYQQGHDQYAAPQHGYGETDAGYDENMIEEDEEPRRGRRMVLIIAALVGAIGLGGALAYTYKTLIASGGRAPLIKAADFGPNKVKPVVPGGKEIAHTDKKLLNRLEEAEGTERAGEDPNAPRRVRIIPIEPGGQAAPIARPAPSVPGIMLDNMGPPPQGPPAARAQPPVQAMPPPVVKAPVKVAAVNTPPPVQPEPAAPVRKAAAPVAKMPVPKKEAAAPATISSSGTSGFVAVLSSQKSRMDALKAFADLQQKYGDVLSAKTPDVQEANLGEKGLWYRAVVGPPGSRDAASGVCSQLKTAGYSGCWVTPY